MKEERKEDKNKNRFTWYDDEIVIVKDKDSKAYKYLSEKKK